MGRFLSGLTDLVRASCFNRSSAAFPAGTRSLDRMAQAFVLMELKNGLSRQVLYCLVDLWRRTSFLVRGTCFNAAAVAVLAWEITESRVDRVILLA